jgi:phosphohistidine swiveling domain-containing protein
MAIYFIGDEKLSQEQTRRFGGKALKLHELKLAGFPVPAGCVLKEGDEFPPSLMKEIGFPVAVRSSGSLEDLEGASFAGLYETFLNVKDEAELKVSIHNCFAAKESARVRDYLEKKKMRWSSETLQMSVLIQKMVPSKIAGVLFTLNPTSGKEEELYLEFCQGLGERLVSGHVTPSRLTYNWLQEKIIQEEINHEDTTLSKDQLRQLVDLSIQIQAHYGSPQDIEWAIGEDDKLYILQSRPVTTFAVRDDYPELTNADFKDGGVSARVCTPCMFSLYRDALQDSMGSYFKTIKLISNDENICWIYSAYGRVYWNAQAVKEGLKKIPDFKEEDFDRDLGIQKHYGEKGPHRTAVNLSSILEAIPVLIALKREFQDCLNMISLFRVRFEQKDAELKASLPKLHQLSEQDFHSWLYAVLLFQQESEKNYFRTIYNNSNYQSEFKSLIKKIKTYEAGDEIDLMGELHGVSHLDVQVGLLKLRKSCDFYGRDSQHYYRSREEFLSLHYHHGPAELDITVPRWGEKKEWVDELVMAFSETSSKSMGSFEKTYHKLSSGLPFYGRRGFLKSLERSREFLKLREEMRSYSTRAYYLVRKGLLELNRRLGLEMDEIFFWDLVEIKAYLLGNPQLPETRKRRLLYQGYRFFKAPNEFGGAITTSKAALQGSDLLKGLGCSPGEFIGRARVIKDIHATHELSPQDILVTVFTDPGWTPVLARVGGVITEVGGLLSHAAVIGREYGIPAILNLIGATNLIQDGDLIHMNGKTGEVKILEKRP